MAAGTVKWFNPTKGYGFIQPQDGGRDVFVHISAVERAGLSSLNEGQAIEYEIVSNRGKEFCRQSEGPLTATDHSKHFDRHATTAASRLENICRYSFATTMSIKRSGS